MRHATNPTATNWPELCQLRNSIALYFQFFVTCAVQCRNILRSTTQAEPEGSYWTVP